MLSHYTPRSKRRGSKKPVPVIPFRPAHITAKGVGQVTYRVLDRNRQRGYSTTIPFTRTPEEYEIISKQLQQNGVYVPRMLAKSHIQNRVEFADGGKNLSQVLRSKAWTHTPGKNPDKKIIEKNISNDWPSSSTRNRTRTSTRI